MPDSKKDKIILPLSQRWLNLKSFILSLYYQVWLHVKKFNNIKAFHGLMYETMDVDYTEEQWLKIQQIIISIRRVENNIFWTPKCYNLALLARKLLTDENIPFSLKIGFRKRNNKIEGHAWVNCGRVIVSGLLPDLHSYNVLKPVKK